MFDKPIIKFLKWKFWKQDVMIFVCMFYTDKCIDSKEWDRCSCPLCESDFSYTVVLPTFNARTKKTKTVKALLSFAFKLRKAASLIERVACMSHDTQVYYYSRKRSVGGTTAWSL